VAAALLRIAALEWQTPPRNIRSAQEAATDFGAFAGLPPGIALLADGRRARLLAPLAFVRADGSEWPVPAGVELDGASIPRIFWSLIGGPFEGRYRDASIIHDYYCTSRLRPWRDTHRVFYEGARCSGESAARAKIMYYAVYRFGPRWDDTEASAAPPDPTSLAADMDAQAASLAADAEAIYIQDLNLQEIESLADARNAVGHAAADEAGDPLERARLLVIPGGTGMVDDVEAVAREAALLPDSVMTKFERERIRIVACRDSVPDFEASLRGVTPRGWPSGSTWDRVPGTYFQDKMRVVIATIASGGRRAVPTKDSGLHGSANLTVHESLHGFDYSGNHAVLRDHGFITARQADMAKLDDYARQEGSAGLEETFAESGARFVVVPGTMAAEWTNLFNYWTGGPLSGFELAVPAFESAQQSEEPIGTAELHEDGTIVLDLRAEGEGSAIGHGTLTVRPGEPSYADLKAHILEAAVGGEEAARRGPVLFKPMKATDAKK
jgi:Protein of unknown function (DUF1353)